MRGGPGVHGRRAGRVHAHGRRLVEGGLQADPLGADGARGRQAADLGVGREPDAAVHAPAAQLLLLGAEAVEVELGEHLVEGALVVARVVDDPERGLVWELVLGDEVPAPDLDRVGADLERQPIHHHLDPVGHLRASGAADRVGGELVREHAGEVQVDGVERVAAAGDREPELRDERGQDLEVRAEVADQPRPHPGDRAVGLRAHGDVGDLVATVVGVGHVLRPGLDPLHRPLELPGEGAQHRFLAVGVELRAEAAADVRGDDAEVVLADPEHAGEDEAGDVGDLRRRAQGDAVAVGLGDRPARLDRRARGAVVGDPVLEHYVGLRQRRVDVAAGDRPLVGLVGAELIPDQWRAVLERRLRVDDDRLRVVLDDHLLGGVEDAVLVAADDDRDRVADALDLAALERHVVGGVDLDPGRRPDHRDAALEAQVLGREHADHARVGGGLGGVDRGDRRVRLGRAHERGVQHAVGMQVVHVAAGAGDEARILAPLHRLPDEAVAGGLGRGLHAQPPFAAAVWTALTMLW